MQRNTIQRNVIYNMIDKLGHSTIEQLVKIITEAYPSISVATIYRNINILEQEKKIRCVKVNGVNNLYEVIRPQHFHFKCNSCGMVYDILPEKISSNNINIIDENFHVESHELNFYGICPKCKNK